MSQKLAESTPLTVNHLCNFFLNIVRGHQKLCSGHPSLLLCQFIEPLESILQVGPSSQLLEILL